MKWLNILRLLNLTDTRPRHRPGGVAPAREGGRAAAQEPVRPRMRRPERQSAGLWQILKDLREMIRVVS
ncbi:MULTISPECIES: hypothetical protein [Streptomyces]|uniref:Uncharacterized protein n=1 Tax=Streptomyces lycii TaxID=2654337 RepID=A0ABQ7FFB7_9ACTN|nr:MULTISPECIES: hypothetical protein [Streptomyces]KAF4407015.1 hypothetical protein GCU69_21995 [Streptomyces lycii]PGH49641.1 hypothetical protein CRI70_16460 [Streptomyces sp. Ru87]